MIDFTFVVSIIKMCFMSVCVCLCVSGEIKYRKDRIIIIDWGDAMAATFIYIFSISTQNTILKSMDEINESKAHIIIFNRE